MSFYEDPKQVDKYENMCLEYDGSELYEILDKHLKKSSSLLELGCGPGNDIEYLHKNYKVTGSDLSDEFLRRCKNRFNNLPFIKLDAVLLSTDERFDSIFSNKVLHHLTMDELERSLQRQQEVLKQDGLFAHTFWIGDKEFTMEGMLFVFHDKEKLLQLISKYFSIQESYEYKEFEDGDSIFVIARNDKTK